MLTYVKVTLGEGSSGLGVPVGVVVQVELGEPEVEDDVNDVRFAVVDAALVDAVDLRRHRPGSVAEIELNSDETVDDWNQMRLVLVRTFLPRAIRGHNLSAAENSDNFPISLKAN